MAITQFMPEKRHPWRRNDADLKYRITELRIFRAYRIVASCDERSPSRKRISVHPGDRHRSSRGKEQLSAAQKLAVAQGGFQLLALLQIETGREIGACALEDQHADRWVFAGSLDPFAQSLQHFDRQGISPFR